MCKGCVFHFFYMQSMSWRANVSAVSCVYKHKFRKCNSSKGTTQLCTILANAVQVVESVLQSGLTSDICGYHDAPQLHCSKNVFS